MEETNTNDSSNITNNFQNKKSRSYSSQLSRSESGELQTVNNYVIQRTLGEGSFGIVKLAVHSITKQKCAIKVFNKLILKQKKSFERTGRRVTVTTAYDKVEQEIAIMKKLIHPNIVRLYEVIDGDDEYLFMVLEYIEAGDCMKYDPATKTFKSQLTNGVLPEELASHHMEDILSGLSFLHLNHICHRDLKPENILLGRDGHVKIADFGVSHIFEEELQMSQRSLKMILKSKSRGQLTKTEGSHYFWSPEICEGLESFSGYAADIWALGIILYVFLFGTIPYPEPENALDIFEIIQTHEFVLPHEVSPQCDDLLRGFLKKVPEERITLRDALEHQWIEMHCLGDENGMNTVPSLKVEVSQEEVEQAYSRVKNISKGNEVLSSIHETEKIKFNSDGNLGIRSDESDSIEPPNDKDGRPIHRSQSFLPKFFSKSRQRIETTECTIS